MLLKKARKMGIGKDTFESTVKGAGDALGGGIVGIGLGLLNGAFNNNAQKQLDQQQKLTDMQYDANLGLMKESYKSQKEMWDATNYEAQRKHLEAAGLNPGLMYGQGGGGGTTTGSGTASVSGGQASDETSRIQAQTQQVGMGLQLAKLKSEIDVNESVAQVNKAQAGKATEETTTISTQRDLLTEKIKQEGKSTWLQNLRTEWENNTTDENGVTVYKNKQYGQGGVSEGSLFTQERTNQVINLMQQANLAEANSLLSNNKAKGYFQELLNDTTRADSTAIQATAQKLAAEWNTGEFTNWKTWAELGKTVIDLTLKGLK